MAVNPDSLKNLKPRYAPKWKHGTTRTIRVPVALADQILDYAHNLDNGIVSEKESIDTTDLRQSLLEIITKIDNKEKGYKNNGSGQLIKDLKALLED